MNQKTKTSILVFFLLLIWAGLSYASGSIDPVNKWAWGTNVGWINFSPSHGTVTVYDDHLEGVAWAENVGWIRLGTCSGSPCSHANSGPTDYGVNRAGDGRLSGFAWGTNIGWINFDPTHGGVTIDPVSGEFDGFAWAENVGWISFQGGSGATSYGVVMVDTGSYQTYIPVVLK